MMRFDTDGDCYVADSYSDLYGWTIIDDREWKEGVRAVSLVTPPGKGFPVEYRHVYLSATPMDQEMHRIGDLVTATMDGARDNCCRMLQATMRKQLRRIHDAHFPRRRFKLIDAMGTTVLWIGDRQLDDVTRRLDQVPEPLLEIETLMSWYVDASSDANIDIDDIVITPSPLTPLAAE